LEVRVNNLKSGFNSLQIHPIPFFTNRIVSINKKTTNKTKQIGRVIKMESH